MSEQSKYKKNKYYYKKNFSESWRKNCIEPGITGFLVTCNFREKDCVRECYNILNAVADDLNPNQAQNEKNEDLDISETLEQEIITINDHTKNKTHRFQVVDTQTTNCIFIKSLVTNTIEIGLKVIENVEKLQQKPRHILRFIPIEIVCRANMKDIIESSEKLFDKYFQKDPKSFSIVFNKRYNNSIKRDEVIKALADLVTLKNNKNTVNLTEPELSVLVEVVKGVCCITVLSDYLKLKKYNLSELSIRQAESENDNNIPIDAETNEEK